MFPEDERKIRMSAVCPICGWKGGDFLPKNNRKSVLCPVCGSFERHRHQFIVLTRLKLNKKIKRMRILHIAPEKCLSGLFRDAAFYVTADIAFGKAWVNCDITRLPFITNSFELVWASHVLEHVRKVGAALSEIKRVLVPKGIAVLDVPIDRDATVELREPGPHGHVWLPGYDWHEQYRKTGFSIEVFGPEICKRQYKVLRNSRIAVCKKK